MQYESEQLIWDYELNKKTPVQLNPKDLGLLGVLHHHSPPFNMESSQVFKIQKC